MIPSSPLSSLLPVAWQSILFDVGRIGPGIIRHPHRALSRLYQNQKGGHKARPYKSKTAQHDAGPFVSI